ncbi:hypothetical protein [Marinitoga lauensis]|uniref:hypothetical protein n=1 Tax=Marinitoga lauensis TaxID=2201189 RepID=UPI00197FE117|nr:hypothetical protein [Marinitoga lauensis]
MIRKFNVKVNGKSYEVEVEELGVENTVSQLVQTQKVESVPTPPPVQNVGPKPAPKPQPKPQPVTAPVSGVKML